MHHSALDTTILALSLIDGIGPVTIASIVDSITKHHITDIHQPSLFDWVSFGIAPRTASALCKGLAKKTQRLDYEQELIAKHSINWLTIADEKYPPFLKQIYAPPPVLYWSGKHPNEYKKSLAIIGSRKANHYAQEIIDQTIPSLVACGWSIVSGGALGADSMAHRATLNHSGSTIAVLGSGLLQPYPHRNISLFKQMSVQNGTVLSALPLMTTPHPGNFPGRNRIIAGLSKGCLVVQAAKASGARITAQYALDEGRTVFAVPGMLNDPLSEGCHALIRDGAILVRSVQDVLSEFGEQSSEQYVKQPVIGEPTSKEDHLFRLCMQKPKSTDELARELELPLPEIQSALFTLQMAGKIEQQFTGKWMSV